MPFRFLPHPADIRVECYGASLQELFESAADALYTVALSNREKRSEIEQTVSISTDTWEDALVQWLQELLFLLDTKAFVGVRFLFTTLENFSCCARILGYRCSPADREREVKAATYHNLHLKWQEDKWFVTFVLDL